MNTFDLNTILTELRVALEADDVKTAITTLEALRSPDQADLLVELDEAQQITLLSQLSPADSADILEELEDEDAAELVAALPHETATRIVDEMEPDEAADVLAELSSEQARNILDSMEDPDEIHPLLLHPDDSAGGLMTSGYLALRRRMTAGDALQAIRQWQPTGETIYHLFVVDRYGKLCGVVSLRQLVVASPDTPLTEIMDIDVISVPVGTDQEECARVMSRYDLLALPVIDDNNILLGVITVDDVVDVLEEEATEDIQRAWAGRNRWTNPIGPPVFWRLPASG